MTDSQKIDLILEKMGGIDRKIDTLGADVAELKTDVAELKTKVSALESDVAELKTKVSALESDVATLKSDMKDVKLEIAGIHLTLENEIRVNIIRVAEGHLDLSRKLDEYIKLSHELKDKQEITDIYIKMHDNKLGALA